MYVVFSVRPSFCGSSKYSAETQNITVSTKEELFGRYLVEHSLSNITIQFGTQVKKCLQFE